MKDDDIRNFIIENIQKLDNKLYDITKYDIDELVKWYIDIWNSLFLEPKEELTSSEKIQVSRKLYNRLNFLLSKWYLDFCKEFIELWINEDLVTTSTNNNIIINSFKVINQKISLIDRDKLFNQNILFSTNNTSAWKCFFEIKSILYKNNKIYIDYIKDFQTWNQKIKAYKLLLINFYSSIYEFTTINKEILDNFYENWSLLLIDEKKFWNLMKIANKVKDNNISKKWKSFHINITEESYDYNKNINNLFWN